MIEATLRLFEYELSLVGAKSFLREMILSTRPEFLVAWTADDSPTRLASGAGAHRLATVETDVLRDAHISGLEILQAVLLPCCESHTLPLCIGLEGGETVESSSDGGSLVVASASVLQQLLADHPQVKFIVVVAEPVGGALTSAIALARNRNAHLVLRRPSQPDLERALGALGAVFTVTSGQDVSVLEELIGETTPPPG